MTPVHFYWSKSSLWLCLALSAGIFLLGLPMVLSESLDVQLLGLIWIGVFGWLSYSLVDRARRTSPVVTLDAHGLFERRIMHQLLAWEEIAGIETFEAESMTWIDLQLADHRKSMAKMSWLVRFCAPLQHLMGMPRVSISLALLDGTTGDFTAAVRVFRPGLVMAGR